MFYVHTPDYFIYNKDFTKIEKKILPLEKKFRFISLNDPFSISKYGKFLICNFDLSLYTLNQHKESEIKYKLDFGKYNPSKGILNENTDEIFEFQNKGEIIANIQMIYNSKDYVCFHYPNSRKRILDFIIYSKTTENVYLSKYLRERNILPKWVIRDLSNNNTFILVVNPSDFVSFCNKNRVYSKYKSKIRSIDNPILLKFRLK